MNYLQNFISEKTEKKPQLSWADAQLKCWEIIVRNEDKTVMMLL